MCGRIDLHTTPLRLAAIFRARLGASIADTWQPSWNVAPSREVIAITDLSSEAAKSPATARSPTSTCPTTTHATTEAFALGHSQPGQHEPGRILVTFRWGLVPPWAADPAIGSRMINARAETVATKASFRSAFSTRRCLILADGFYEWSSPSHAGARVAKTPFYFRRTDGSPLALAGLWESWVGSPRERAKGGRSDSRHPDGRPDSPVPHAALRTCTIITTCANPDVAPVHHRMPVLIEQSDIDRWLLPSPLSRDTAESLLEPTARGVLTGYEVDPAVNDPAHDDESVVRPFLNTDHE